MAVSPKAQGKGVGLLLGKSIVERAKLMGVKRLYLESNSVLKPAVSLYEKIGFKHIKGASSPYARCDVQNIKGASSPYARCDVQMELYLNK